MMKVKQDRIASYGIFGFIGSSYSSVQEIVNVIVFCALFLTLMHKRRFKLGPEHALLLLFMISIVASLFFSIDFDRSLIPTIYMLYIIGMSVTLSFLVKTAGQYRHFLLWIVLAFLVLGVRNFMFGSVDGVRAGGVSGQPNSLAVLSSSGVVFCLIYWRLFFTRYVKARTDFIFVISTGVISIFWLYMSASRGALFALFLAGLFIVFSGTDKKARNLFFSVIGGGAFFYVFGDYIAQSLVFKRVVSSLETLNFLEGSYAIQAGTEFDVRASLARIALSAFYERPLLGNGASTFIYYSDYVYTHSTHLEILFSYGLIGSAFFYLFILLLIIKGVKNVRPENSYATSLLCLTLFFLVLGITIPVFQSRLAVPIYASLLILFRHVSGPKKAGA